jgi:hypothetical protein
MSPSYQRVHEYETAEQAPSLALFRGRMFIAWKGNGNDQPNVAILSPGSVSVYGLG